MLFAFAYVRAGVEHAFDRVHRASHVGSRAFDVRECWSHQHQQGRDDGDDDEQLEEREGAGALTSQRSQNAAAE